MKCPFCSKDQLIVTNTRSTKQNTQIWRRRKCLSCGEFLTTYELIDLSYLHVMKSNGSVQVYNRAKLFSGIYRASMQKKNVDKYGRGLLVEKITGDVETEILALKQKVITTDQIRHIILSHLRKSDPTLFLSFLAYFAKPSIHNLKSILQKYL